MKQTKKANRLSLFTLLTLACLFFLSQRTWADTHYYTDVMVVQGDYDRSGWNHFDQDLNDGAGGEYIYLLYKDSKSLTPENAITDIMFRCDFKTPGEVTDEFVDEAGVRWTLAPYDGSSRFKNSKGDLNCGAEGAYIYMYYTKHKFDDKRIVTSIWFNDESAGSVSGMDLNKDAGGDYIYMHLSYMRENDGVFSDASSAFTWNTSGRGSMHFKLLTSLYSPYRTFHYATFSLKDENGNKIPLFYLNELSSSSDKDFVKTEFKNLLPAEATLFLTNSTLYSPKYCLITSNDDQQLDYYRENGKGKASGNGYAELEWFYPARFAGKSYVLCVDGSMYYNDSGTTGFRDYSREIGSISFDDIMFDAYDPVPGTDFGEEGMVKIPCVSDHALEWLNVSYKDGYGQWKKLPSVKIDNGLYAGFALLPATEPHDSVTISARIVTATWDKDKLGDPTWPTDNKNTLSLVLDSVPMLHNPRMLTANMDSLGSVMLQWKVSKPQYPELLETDQFVVQRSLTGKLDDFQSIGNVFFETGTEDYTFKDSLLISSLKPEMIDSALGVPLVRYRVVRAAALQLWGETKNPSISYVQPQISTLSLLQPTKATADWSDREESKILVKWDYLKNDKSHTYVWDERAEMCLNIEMTDRDGNLVGKTTQVLSNSQIADSQLELTLHNSCVFYKISLVTDSKGSPIGKGTGKIFMQIASKEDYETFKDRINKGETELNAILTSDISAGKSVLSTNSDKPYCGIFNGNGHQISFNFTNYDKNYLAPFVHVGNGFVVTNLKTAGELESGNKYVAGLVSHPVDGIVSIENCTVGLTINATGSGDATHGGVVALQSCPGLYISNTLFNGAINLGSRTYSGGFVGWRDSTAMAAVSNSYYAGGTTDDAKSATFVRHRNNMLTFLDDCSYKNAFGTPQALQSDNAPDNQCWADGIPMTNQVDFSTPVATTTTDVQLPDSAFYYENNGKLVEKSLSARQLQSSVLLEWATDGGAIDYFIVKRRDQNKSEDAWETIATQITDNRYEDKATAPLHTYDYCVLAANDCQGVSYQTTDTITGSCAPTGTLAGYVRFPDGSGIAGLTVNITSGDNSVKETAVTDESGYFYKEGLPYWNDGDNRSGVYRVAPNLTGYAEIRNITFGTEPGSNLINNVEFYVEDNVKFSGFVLYNGTSIPVKGVSFFVDGHEVRTASGPVSTDFEGKFAFRMLPGDHIIQVKKDGHTFYQDGYYYEGNDTTKKSHHFDIDKAGVYFYDDTRVKLIGRVAGGKDQEAIPLDNSLSRNNLGDDLQMVFTLEGDRASRLVWDIQNASLKERDEVFHHPTHDDNDYFTTVHTSLYRMTVKPDVRTGEYEVMLPPVKWKIEQITAKGYATLFQDGHTSDVLDLSDSLTLHTDTIYGQWRSKSGEDLSKVQVQYHAQYNRIYHAPVNISYKQISYDTFDYFGNRYYMAKNLDGTSAKVELVRPVRKEGWPAGRRDSLRADYTFGYPVFNIERNYPFKISATERYYYNNFERSDSVDIVRLSGGKVTIRNGFVSSTHSEVIELDSVGEYNYQVKANQIPYMTTGKEALRTMTMTLEMDGTYYEAEPLRAYILNITTLPGSSDLISIERPVLIDVLRDPPGSGSSAKLSKNSTLSSSFMLDINTKIGVTFHIGVGNSFDTWQGVGAGVFNKASNVFDVDFDLVWDSKSQAAYTYTMKANTDISTSSDKYMISADGDVYIGLNTNTLMKQAVAIRAIPDSVYQQMRGDEAAGRLLVINKGVDSQTGDPLYLVRSTTMAVGQEVKSTFVHSQHYILNQLMPEIVNQCYSLMFTGTREEAQRKANATGKNVYLSLRQPDDESFGIVNTKETLTLGEDSWEYVYNDSIFEAQEGINYVIIRPNNTSMLDKEDLVADYSEALLAWAQIIAHNEYEKVNATNLMRNFDIDGSAGLSYSEEFESKHSVSSSNVDISTNFKYGNGWNIAGNIGSGVLSVLGEPLKFVLQKLLPWLTEGTKLGEKKTGNNNSAVEVTGIKWDFYLIPVLDIDIKPTYSGSETFSRKESFTIAMDRKSHLNFDVFYAEATTSSGETNVDWSNVFMNDNFENIDGMVLEQIFNENSSLQNYVKTKRGFIYRTLGGATLRTWEDERRTIFYNPGTILDARTKKVENPIIQLDKQSISGVPFGEPARLKVMMTNESEMPEATYRFFDLYLDDITNPNGAKVMMDGMPLTNDGRAIEVNPGVVTTKTIEVYAGVGFDYENLTLCLMSQDDLGTYQTASFSVHYLQTAGEVSISSPGDKWIMNTDAPYDSSQGWYLPIIISGFDRNQHNFDHIEFQYKESLRGDDYWTNLCAFYADSLYYRQASGTKEMIPDNGNITTKFYGEGVVMEKGYDLRAVLFCRNGNGYLTNASKVLTGIKDTRRPQLFGIPEPKDGILGVEDDIVFNFSEQIEHNYLQATTNFEVKGETNETTIQENSALLFSGEGCAESDARRNFGDKSVTVEVMIKPEATGKAMPIFSHGRDGKQLQLWLTENNLLRAVVDGKVIDGTTPLTFDGFKRVAMVLDNEQHTLSLYADNLEAEMDSVTYTGVGPLIFGATNQVDVSKRSFYTGRMLQGRVWNRAMDLIQLNMYGNKLLTGYEVGLTDYYPMNEGTGNFAEDGAQGAHLRLNNVGWTVPRSMSLQLDKKQKSDGMKGLQLKEDFFSRDADQDYTLMFWFKTDEDGRGALISNGSGRSTDVEPADRFFVGFESSELKYRANGQEFILGSDYSDDKWHHFALTMNKAAQVANIYLDFKPKASFSTENIGGMGGNHFYLGNMVWNEQGPDNDKRHQQNAMTGQIDGLTLFEQALPPVLVQRYGSKGLSGEEKGLKTYLDFCRQERQKDGQLLLVPYALNKVVHRDADGNISERNDTVFTVHADTILAKINQDNGAPIQAFEELRELNFSYVGSGHQLLVNIDELNSRINKRRVYVTVSEIPDMNGNIMASPATLALFIDRNPLRWGNKHFTLGALKYGEDHQFTVNIVNNSGANHTYTIDDMPKWLSVDRQSDVIGPKEEIELTFSISKDVNVGTYDNVIYLVDEDGLHEPLPLSISIEGETPEWTVSDELKRFSMNIVGRLRIREEIITDSRDIVGIFDKTGRCMGVGNVNYDATNAESLVYLTAYDSSPTKQPLEFRLWHYETGKIMVLLPSQPIDFTPNAMVGTVKEPVLLTAGDQYIQSIDLVKGWNWIAFNVYSNDFRKGVEMLSRYNWQDGDMIIDDNNNLVLCYESGQWISNKGEEGLDKFSLSVSQSYRIKSNNENVLHVPGSILRQPSYRQMTVKNGWNNIGYTPTLNLPVSTALSDYFDEAEDGDVIKSRSDFAIFTEGANGSKEWKGSLKYMKPGEGYMLYRSKQEPATFTYAFYEPDATIFDATFIDKHSLLKISDYARTMSLTAQIEGVGMEEGDRILVFNGADVVGESLVETDAPVYLSIAGNKAEPLSFAVERDGELIATATDVLNYKADAIVGTPNQPTVISFTKTDMLPQEGYYNLQGIKLSGKPQQRGVYIYNGRKQVVK